MPKPRAVARNADRNPNLGGSTMEGKHGYKMPKSKKMSYSSKMKSGSKMSNAIRAANVKRMGKSHNSMSY